MSGSILLEPWASLVTQSNDQCNAPKIVNIPSTSLGRVVYFKDGSEVNDTITLTTNEYVFVSRSTSVTLKENKSIMLQAFSTTGWGILGGYNGTNVFSTQILPAASDIVNPAMRSSELFVDLRTQSKTIVLPPINTLTTLQDSSPFYSIKDVYGYASVNPFYISSSLNNVLENLTINNALRINQDFASIDLVANPNLSKWHILNYYNGTLVSRP